MSSLWSPKAPSTPKKAPSVPKQPETEEFNLTDEQKEAQRVASLESQQDNRKVRRSQKARSLLNSDTADQYRSLITEDS